MRAKRSPRRSFLKKVPAAVAAGLAMPSFVDAQSPASSDAVTADTLGMAQQVSGLELPAAEREQARTIVARNRDNYQLLREVTVAGDVEPAFSFRPLRPASTRVAPPAARTRVDVSTAGRDIRRPARLEDLAFEPVTTLARLVRSKKVSALELTEMYLARLERHDPTLMCVVTLTKDLALAQAADADREIRAGHYRGLLHGIPYGIKDLFAVKGVATTWGATPYASQVFDYDATVVTRLREAGAVLVAKLSTGELAVGDLWFRGRTRNPWNPERGSSGSSAGPASATAAGLVGFAVGTETGGSIVSPASACGVVGLRPTYGRVSRHGCMTLRWTLDKVGPLTRSVEDAAVVLAAMHGPDEHDETVTDTRFSWNGDHSAQGLRIGYVEREFAEPESAATADERQQWARRQPIYEAALETYRRAGATLVPIALPTLPAPAIYAVLNAEAGAMFDELVRSGAINELADKGPNGRANQLRATRFIPAVEYIRAQRVRTLLGRAMNELFDDLDVFLAPSQSESVTIANLTGHPAMAVPAGFVDGLPTALLVTGRLYDEATVLRAAAAFEGATEWHTKHPSL